MDPLVDFCEEHFGFVPEPPRIVVAAPVRQQTFFEAIENFQLGDVQVNVDIDVNHVNMVIEGIRNGNITVDAAALEWATGNRDRCRYGSKNWFVYNDIAVAIYHALQRTERTFIDQIITQEENVPEPPEEWIALRDAIIRNDLPREGIAIRGILAVIRIGNVTVNIEYVNGRERNFLPLLEWAEKRCKMLNEANELSFDLRCAYWDLMKELRPKGKK